MAASLAAVLMILYGMTSVESRSILRSSPFDMVNLVEKNSRGTIYGTCIYFKEGQEIVLTYEDFNGEISANAHNFGVLHPDAQVVECREKAKEIPSQPPLEKSIFEIEARQESLGESEKRLTQLQNRMTSNNLNLNKLRPRYDFPLLSALLQKFTGGSSSFPAPFPPNSSPLFGFSLPSSSFFPMLPSLPFPFHVFPRFENPYLAQFNIPSLADILG